jgi:hypothetical protein
MILNTDGLTHPLPQVVLTSSNNDFRLLKQALK